MGEIDTGDREQFGHGEHMMDDIDPKVRVVVEDVEIG